MLDENLSLLLLPSHIRHRIYLWTGLARVDGCPYTYHLDGRKEPRSPDFDPPPRPNFAGLLLSCRTLYAEAAALLYSANQFVISYSGHGSLAPLRSLSPTPLASLTSLKIVLNEPPCHQPDGLDSYPPKPCCGKRRGPGIPCCAECHRDARRRPLLGPAEDLASAKQSTQDMLSEWYDTATHISPQISAQRLELSLVCDIDSDYQGSLDVGRLAVAPIALFPQLRKCHILLCHTPDHPLQRLAKTAVLQACRATPPSLGPTKASSTLANLPTELRLQILEYTDLITPWKEVTWSRQDRGYQVARPPCTIVEGSCPPHIHHGCRLSGCSPYGEGLSEPLRHPGCFCRRRHAAFSFPLTCNCWAPPTARFLVCRALCRDAQFVFFSGNRFIVHDFRAMMPWSLPDVQCEPVLDTAGATRYYPYDRLAASEFLRDIIPIRCLAHLRFLELVFPPYVPHGWPWSEHAAILDWIATADWIRGKVDAPALTVRFAMVDFHDTPHGREELAVGQGGRIIQGYSTILGFLRPLVREDGLGGIYVQAAYPRRWTEDTARRMRRRRNWLAEAEQSIKEKAEEFVRGKDPGRDPRGSAEPRESSWRRWYEVAWYYALGA